MSDESRRNRENITRNPEHVEGEIRKATQPTAVTPPPTSDTIGIPPVSGPQPVPSQPTSPIEKASAPLEKGERRKER
jgi:hypothetical protein